MTQINQDNDNHPAESNSHNDIYELEEKKASSLFDENSSREEIPNPQYTHKEKGITDKDFKAYKSVQNFALAASICGAVSVIIGGILLGGIGLGLGIASYIKYRKLDQNAFNSSLIRKVKISSIVAIVVCLGAMILNFVSAVVLLPTIFEYLESNDLASLSSMLNGSATSSSSGSSTWG